MADPIISTPTPTPTTTPLVVPTPTTTATATVPTPQPSTPSTPPSAVDFSAFESARDLTPDPTPIAPAPVVPPITPVVVPSTPTITSTIPPIAPVVTPDPAKPSTTPVPTTSLDKDGKPTPIELDLTQSPFLRQQQTTPTPSFTKAPTEIVDGRDMTGFTTDEREAFKRMSNESFNLLAPAYREAKELKSKLPNLTQENETLKQQIQKAGTLDANTAANPNGFILDPQYQQAIRIEQNIDTESSYWQNQMAELKSGKKPRMLLWDGQRYQQGQELEPDARTEAFLLSKLAEVSSIKTQVGQQRQQLEQGWSQRVQQDVGTIRQLEDRYFPWFAEGKQHSFGPVIDGIVNQLPPTQRSNPLARAIGKSYALIQYLQGELTKAKQITPSATITQSNQGPLGISAPVPVPVTTGTPEDIMAAYESVKQR